MKQKSRWSKNIGISLSFLVVFLMVLSAVNTAGTTQVTEKNDVEITTSEPDIQISKNKAPQYLRIGMQDDMKHLNTVTAQDVWDWNVLGWLMDGPINRDKISKKPMPWMAESWNYSSDNPTVGSMTLRKGMFWTDHDFDTYGEDVLYDGETYPMGETDYTATPGYREVTAYDLEFSYNLCKDAPRYQNGLDPLRIDDKGDNDPTNDVLGVTAVDRYTLEYELDYATADFVMDILAFIIWPEHIWSNHLDDKMTWQPEVEDAVYCGMFTLESWEQDAVIVLKTNEHYWNKSAIPNIDGILFKIFGNTDAAILALQSDDIDFIAWTIAPGYIPTIQEDPDLAIAKTKELGFFYLSYNFRNPAFGYDDFGSENRNDVGKPLRKAIAHCINKEDIVLKLLQGYGTVGDSAVSPANPEWYNTTVPTYSFDPNKAEEILQEAGYYKVDGAYVSPDGSPIDGPGGDGSIEIIHPPADYDPIRAEVGRMIAEQLNAIGVTAESKPVDFGTLVDKTNTHDFEAFILGWSIGSTDGSYMYDFFRSDPNDVVGGYNSPGYRNSSYDEIVDAMREELDLDERIRFNKWSQGVIAEDLVYNILYYRDNLEAYRTSTWKSGWWEERGGIFNQWTLMELRSTEKFEFSVDIEGPDQISGDSDYTVTVLDKDENPVPDAEVEIREISNGEFSPRTGTTDANGEFDFVFSPDIVEVQTAVSISAAVTVTIGGEESVEQNSKQVVVYPPGAFWLETTSQVTISTPVDYQEALDAGIPFEVRVKDPADGWISGAVVNVDSNYDGVFDSDSQSTSIDGVADFVFTPAEGLSENTIFIVTAQISYDRPDDSTTYEAEERIEFKILVTDISMQITSMAFDNQSPKEGDSVTLTITLVEVQEASPVSGAQVTLTVPDGITADSETGTTDSSGQASFTLTGDEAGTYSITAEASKDTYETTARTGTISFAEKSTGGGGTPMIGMISGLSVLVLIAVAVLLLKKRNGTE